MENFIFIDVQPFDLTFDIQVHVNGDSVIHHYGSPFGEIPTLLKNLCDKYDVSKVKLSGAEDYCLGLKDNIVATEFDNSRVIEVEIIK